jgi:hypothetical protein
MGGSSSARRCRLDQYRREKEIRHVVMITAIKKTPEINIWQSDFIDGYPDICEFCKGLNATWFHRIKNRNQNMDLTAEDLKKMKDMYMQHVYDKSGNFPLTWRDRNTWTDVNGNALVLKDITEEEIKEYYFDRCPRPPIHIIDVISFILTTLSALFVMAVFAAICA